jgi:carboxyl-terminal processing protease
MLRSEDGYAKIESLVPGGPAQTDGRLKVGDRITAVAQGPAEYVDVREMRLDKVVEMIRGKKAAMYVARNSIGCRRSIAPEKRGTGARRN